MAFHIYPGAAPQQQWILQRQLASRPDNKEPIINEIVDLLDEHQCFEEADRHWLLMCLDEAIVNAMVHGNEGDPGLDIDVRVGINDAEGRWCIVVSDQGEGFVAEDVPDADDPESLMLEHGRGILLMNQWLDELSYYDNGSTIYMARACAPAED